MAVGERIQLVAEMPMNEALKGVARSILLQLGSKMHALNVDVMQW